MKFDLKVRGMHCKSCGILIRETLEDAGAKKVTLEIYPDENSGRITGETDQDLDEIRQQIETAGDYEVYR